MAIRPQPQATAASGPRFAVAPAPSPAADHPVISRPVIIGSVIVLLFFGVFGAWASLAPLESAAIAPGIVSVESNRKTVQHLEGGIIGKIHVRDGDVVRKGQVIVTLDETKARASLELLRGRWLAAKAQEARLIAERDDASEVVFPKEVLDETARPEVAEATSGQLRIFASRREALLRQQEILTQKSAQLREEIVGLKGQIKAEDEQLRLLAGEIKDVKGLVNQGLARRPRLLALQRRQAEISGSRSRNIAAIARSEQSITEAELRVAELRTQQVNEVVQSLREVQTELYDLRERIRAAEDVLTRTQIRAPQDGIVVNLQLHTEGGVVAPGQPILDIVPSKERKVVEARIDPQDIDVVKPGLEARVRLTALPQRNLVPIEGKVTSVSADRLVDEKTGLSYFSARIELTDDPRKGGLKDEVLYPGMQAEVLIVTGSRTLLEYMTGPVMQSFNRAFRES